MEQDADVGGQFSRRVLVKGAAGTAAVGTAAFASAIPAEAAAQRIAHSASGDSASETHPATTAEGELVVHVRDLRAGDLDVYIGTRHLRVRDCDLARRIAAVAR